jgi:hypothetical protein
MKCIYCAKDSRKAERKDGRCPKCKRMFAFEPYEQTFMTCQSCAEVNPVTKLFGNSCRRCRTKIKNTGKNIQKLMITDRAFQIAVQNVSDGGTLFYTPHQLYYQLFRPKTKPKDIKIGGASGGGFSGLAILLYVLLAASAFAGLVFALGAVYWILLATIFAVTVGVHLIVKGLLPSPQKVKTLAERPSLGYGDFQHIMLNRWVQTHGLPPKMLPEGGRARPADRQPTAPDVAQYSFDRLLVVDKDETVDMLLANNLHFETNTPIVSINGYPQDVFQNVMSMVRRNPNLKVFALHDASPEGCLLPIRLREDPNWFPNPQIMIFDTGLRPRNVGKLTAMQITRGEPVRNLPPELNRTLSPGERRWLSAGNRGELAALKPSALMKSIYQTFRNAAQEEPRLRASAANDPRGFFQTNPPTNTALPGQPPNPTPPLPTPPAR